MWLIAHRLDHKLRERMQKVFFVLFLEVPIDVEIRSVHVIITVITLLWHIHKSVMLQTLTVECTVINSWELLLLPLDNSWSFADCGPQMTSIKKKNNDVRDIHLCTKIIIFTLYYRARVMYLLGDGKRGLKIFWSMPDVEWTSQRLQMKYNVTTRYI